MRPSTACPARTPAPRRSTPGGTASPATSSWRSSPPRPARSATSTASRPGPATPPTPSPSTATSPTGATPRTSASSPPTRRSGWPTPRPPRRPSTPSPRASRPDHRREHRRPSSTSTTPPPSTATARSRSRPGDLDTADNVAVTVPGFGTDAESAPYQADRARTLYESTRFLDPNQTNATDVLDRVRRPRQPALGRATATGAGVLTESDGERRRRAARRHPRRPARLPRRRAGPHDGDRPQLRLDDHRPRRARPRHPRRRRGLRGQPGRRRRHQQRRRHRRRPRPRLGGRQQPRPDRQPRQPRLRSTARPWSAPGSATTPPRTTSAPTGSRPSPRPAADDAFGLDAFADHSKYFDHDTESLYNISQIVNGNYDAVQHAGQSTTRGTTARRTRSSTAIPTSPATRLDP